MLTDIDPGPYKYKPYKYKGREFQVFLTPHGLKLPFVSFVRSDKWLWASSRGELEKKIAGYVDHEESVVTEEHGVIELAPYEYRGKEYQIFLTRRDLFKSPVDTSVVTCGYLVADSRAALKNKIADCVEASRPHLFFPIMQIYASPEHGFDLSRYWVAEALNETYWCGWDTPKELRESVAMHDPDRLPQGINRLPFVVTIGDQYDVYYGLFDQRMWTIVHNLNDRLAFTLAINKNAVINRIFCSRVWGQSRIPSSPDVLFGQLLSPQRWEEAP